MSIQNELDEKKNPEKALFLQTYFKTGPGEYGEGDVFIGLTVPEIRTIAKKYWLLPYGDIQKLLQSPIHEYRLCAALILVYRFEKDEEDRKKVYDFYLEQTDHINNWDIVDSSAAFIVGAYLQDKARQPLYKLARSKNMWERRIAIIATHAFIKKHQFADTLAIAELLLHDKEDLLHKATGWMLREVGKESMPALERFLRQHSTQMPRTMLRYAIEKMPEKKRKEWLKKSKNV